jgi:hypothetical protein
MLEILNSVRAALEPFVRELRSSSAVMPTLVDAEHRRVTAVRERLAEIEREYAQTQTRLHANARRMDSMRETPISPPPSGSIVLPFFGSRRHRP